MSNQELLALTLFILVLSQARNAENKEQDLHETTQTGHSHYHDQQAQKIFLEHQQELGSQTDQQKVAGFLTSCQREVGEWLSLPKNKTLDRAIYECYVLENATQLIGFYQELSSQGEDIGKAHINLIPKLFRKYKHVSNILTCLAFLRQFQNQFFKQKKKLKYILQFIGAFPEHAKNVFPRHDNFPLMGQRSCSFLKVLFEYYYVQVVSSMQSLSTSLMRALTLRTDVFDHYDIAYCISLDTIGRISSSLEDLSINNIFIKIPEVFHQLKHLKLKEECKVEENYRLVRNLRTRLEGLQMFNIMYNQHEAYVEIATQKSSQSQIRLLARQFATILSHKERYLELSKPIQKEQTDKKVKGKENGEGEGEDL